MMPNIEQLIINYELFFEEDIEPDPLPTPLTPAMVADYANSKLQRMRKLRKFTINYMLPLDGWVSRCQEYFLDIPFPEASRFLQRCRHELDEATQIFAGLGIVLMCTIPSDEDLLRVPTLRSICCIG